MATLNELGKAVMDMGLPPFLHRHTGTCVETRDETYAVLEAVDTRVMKFGPDIGQLQKGGSDPVQVDIPKILSMMDGRKTAGLVMVELDSRSPQPAPSSPKRKDRKSVSREAWGQFPLVA